MPYSPPTHSLKRQKANRLAGQRQYNKTKRKNQDFYNSKAWKKTSRLYRQNNPLCVECKKTGRPTPVDVVDHIIEIEDGGNPLSADNLQSLCHAHHNAKTARERVGRVKSL